MKNELENLLDRVLTLYHRYGIKSVTMDDVARELGISKKTLYEYVSDKNELVNKAVLFDIERHFNYIDSIEKKELNAIDELFEINRYLTMILRNYNPSWDYDLKKYYSETYSELISKRREQLLKSITDNIKRGINEGYFREDLNAEIIGKLHLLRIENINNSDIFTADEFASPEVFDELFYYHIRGIANKKGLEYIEQKIKTDTKHQG